MPTALSISRSSLRSLIWKLRTPSPVGVNRATLTSTAKSRFELVDTSPTSSPTIPSASRKLRLGSHLRSFPLFYPSSRTSQPAGISWHRWRRALLLHRHAVPRSIRALYERSTRPAASPNQSHGGTAIYQGGAISQTVRQEASGTLDHTYNGFYIQDKWRATSKLTLMAASLGNSRPGRRGFLNTQ